MKVFGLAISLLGLLLSVAAAGQTDFNKIKADRKPQELKDPSAIGRDPSRFLDRYIQITGKVTGIMDCAWGANALVQMDAGSLVVANPSRLSELRMGSRLDLILFFDPKSADCSVPSVLAVQKPEEKKPPAKRQVAAATGRYLGRSRQSRVSSRQPRVVYEYSSRSGSMVDAYERVVRYFNRRLSSSQSRTIAQSILDFSYYYGVDPVLVVSVIAVESGFKPTATSYRGAMGLGQLMPGTAAGLGVRHPYNPQENLAGAIRLIRGHLDQFQGSADQFALAMASYNAGSGAVRRYGGVPPYRETRAYIRKIYNLYCRLLGVEPQP